MRYETELDLRLNDSIIIVDQERMVSFRGSPNQDTENFWKDMELTSIRLIGYVAILKTLTVAKETNLFRQAIEEVGWNFIPFGVFPLRLLKLIGKLSYVKHI